MIFVRISPHSFLLECPWTQCSVILHYHSHGYSGPHFQRNLASLVSSGRPSLQIWGSFDLTLIAIPFILNLTFQSGGYIGSFLLPQPLSSAVHVIGHLQEILQTFCNIFIIISSPDLSFLSRSHCVMQM